MNGWFHFWTAGLIAIAFFTGAVLIDADHLRSHSLKQMWDGFRGRGFISDVREDSMHIMHQTKTYIAVFLGVGIMLAFAIGYFVHLRLDGII